jgi:two-component system response regulator MprA
MQLEVLTTFKILLFWTSNVLEVYIGYLRQKLEAQGESRIIQTVRGVGYALRE